MSVAARVVSIGVLTILITSIPWWFGSTANDLVMLPLIFPVAAINTAIFMIGAGVRLSIRQARQYTGDSPGAYSDRFRSHLFTWTAVTAVASLTVWAFLAMLSSELDLSGEGDAPFALLMMVPTFIVGVISSAIVELAYESVLKKRASRVS